MKAYKIEILVLDFDKMGENEIRLVLENTRYPNHCISPKVKNIESRDIGVWTDEHPLNQRSTAEAAYQELFGAEPASPEPPCENECWIQHAKATPPWTCPCPCHNRKKP